MEGLLSYPVRYDERDLSISVRVRVAGDRWIFMLHGLGCSKEFFDAAFDACELQRFSLCAVDFPSHGDSSPLEAPLTSIQAYADVVNLVIRRTGARGPIMVCHSMGGAVGLLAVRDWPWTTQFVSVEGNLIGEDCGIVSRNTAAQGEAEFVHSGFASFLTGLKESESATMRAWAASYEKCEPAGLHAIARSLVRWSDTRELYQIFTHLPRASYIHGSRSELDYLLPQLDRLPTRVISNAGHFLMLDNPAEFYGVLGEIVTPVAGADLVPSGKAAAGQ